MVKVAFLMANYGHDPTETAIPYQKFKDEGFEITFVTEGANPPKCDAKMLTGTTQKLLGANKDAIATYNRMQEDVTSSKVPVVSWAKEGFTLDEFDLVFLPGGHEKSVAQVINSLVVHRLLAEYFPQTRRISPDGNDQAKKNKCCAAICHGVMVLSESNLPNSKKSVIHDAQTTALPGAMEQGIFWTTRLWLGDYYKTYGAKSDSVETSVKKRLDDPKQFKSSLSSSPFVVEDPTYNYISARFPPDAGLLAERAIAMVKQVDSS